MPERMGKQEHPPVNRQCSVVKSEGRPLADAAVAEFVVAGEHCLVVAADPSIPLDAGVASCDGNSMIAGQIRIKEESHLVICTHAEADDECRTIGGTPIDLAGLLTNRELEIAFLVSRGQVNKQIAYQLHISEYTVSTHLRRIFCKLGVSSRAAMVARVVAHCDSLLPSAARLNTLSPSPSTDPPAREPQSTSLKRC